MQMTNHTLKTAFSLLLLLTTSAGYACTNFIVGKKASRDGSVIVSYNADSYGCYGVMQHFPAAKHPKYTTGSLTATAAR